MMNCECCGPGDFIFMGSFGRVPPFPRSCWLVGSVPFVWIHKNKKEELTSWRGFGLHVVFLNKNLLFVVH